MASETMTEERCRILIMPRSHHMDEERCCRVHGVTWKLRWHRKPRVESDVEPEECPVAIADRLRAENARMRDPSAIAATIAKLTDDERREVNLALLTTGRIIMDSSAARAGYDELADRVRALGDENARLTADLESSDVANAARLSVENEALRRENAELRERAKALEMHLENVLTVARPVTARDKHICEEAVYVWEGYARPAKEGR